MKYKGIIRGFIIGLYISNINFLELSLYYRYIFRHLFYSIGDWGIGDWGLGIGPNPQSPNPQSPIPNPQYNINKYF